MRRIGYRGWMIRSRKMVWPTGLALLDDGHVWMKVPGYGNVGELACVLMEFTGLQDRLGIDIYESDIVTWETQDYGVVQHIGVIMYRGAGFIVKTGSTYYSGAWLAAAAKDVKVIGNIYANPELVKEGEKQ